MADATADEIAAPAAPSLIKRMVKMAGIAALCIVALLIGLIASLGIDRVSAMLGGSDPAPVQMPATDHAATLPGASGHGDPVTADAQGAGHGTGHGDGAAETLVVTPMKEIIVNVTATTATGRQTTRFLKLNLALVYDETRAGAENIDDRMLFLRDSFQDYLRQLNEVDLQGSIGLVRLKAELLRRARAIADSDAPQEILIADLIIQ